MAALSGFDDIELYPINPKQLASYRDAVCPSEAKDAPGDARLLARFLQHHHQQFRRAVAAHPDQAIFRALPGPGEALVPRLIAAFGSDWDRSERVSKRPAPRLIEWSVGHFATQAAERPVPCLSLANDQPGCSTGDETAS